MEKNRTGAILAIYLLGLLLGGLYVGMVAPVRTVIQEYFAIDSATGIWMINIYSLFYAALIPVMMRILWSFSLNFKRRAAVEPKLAPIWSAAPSRPTDAPNR